MSSASSEDVRERPSRNRGRFTLSFSFVLVVGLVANKACLELSYAGPIRDWSPIILGVLIALGLIAFIVTSLVVAICMRRWRTVASVTAAPFLAYAVMVAAEFSGLTTTAVRFALTRPGYAKLVSEAIQRGDERPLIMKFHWGESGGAAMTNVFGTLIYDESDEITKPAEDRSKAWNERAASRESPVYRIANPDPNPRWRRQVEHLGDHFYLITETY